MIQKEPRVVVLRAVFMPNYLSNGAKIGEDIYQRDSASEFGRKEKSSGIADGSRKRVIFMKELSCDIPKKFSSIYRFSLFILFEKIKQIRGQVKK